jgi:TPR repeat protein
MYVIGEMYENGEGVPRDLTEARKWYQKAINAGDDEYAKEKLAELNANKIDEN